SRDLIGKRGDDVPRDFLGETVQRQISNQLKTRLCLHTRRKRRRQPNGLARNEFDRRILFGLERPALNVSVAHLLVALERTQIDRQFRVRRVDRAVRVQDDDAGHGLSRANRIAGEIDAGQLLAYFVSGLGPFSDFEFGWLRRIDRRSTGASPAPRLSWGLG